MSLIQSCGFILITSFILHVHQEATGQLEQEFNPLVTATCKAGYMSIKVNTSQGFGGAVHAKEFRSPSCITYGNGSQITSLGINLLAPQGSPEYCGVLVNNRTEERSVPISIRIHRTLELADDKSYVITCGKTGFRNTRNETSIVSLKLLDLDGRRVQEAVYGHSYTLRAEISRPDEKYGIRVKSCMAFSKKNSSVPLIDEKGCPINPSIITPFKYDNQLGHADATLHSMFRFSEDSQIHFQCDIAICKGSCSDATCEGNFNFQVVGFPQAQQLPPKDIYSEAIPDEGVLMASTSVFVLQPGEQPTVGASCDGENGTTPAWLLYLCVAFGLLFLIMLVINVFLCSAMTCSCARTEVIEKEPSIIEDYDPYRSWHGSQYGSRYSLNGKPGYTSGGSTMNSTRSISTNSDHYAIVQSRPGSRYSTPGLHKNGVTLRPSSHIGSQYSGKL